MGGEEKEAVEAYLLWPAATSSRRRAPGRGRIRSRDASTTERKRAIPSVSELVSSESFLPSFAHRAGRLGIGHAIPDGNS